MSTSYGPRHPLAPDLRATWHATFHVTSASKNLGPAVSARVYAHIGEPLIHFRRTKPRVASIRLCAPAWWQPGAQPPPEVAGKPGILLDLCEHPDAQWLTATYVRQPRSNANAWRIVREAVRRDALASDLVDRWLIARHGQHVAGSP